jgi:ribosomal protein L16 Arg81 hydroxylase
MNLEWLVYPFTRHDFVHEYFEKKPLIIKRADPLYFNRLLTVEGVDEILRRGQITGRIEMLMLKASGKIYPMQFLQSRMERNVSIRTGFDFEKMLQLFESERATLLINGSNQEWAPIRELSANVSRDLLTRAGPNIFVTPAHAQCFPIHYDEHDLFIIQIAGKKRWRIYETARYLPLEPQNGNAIDYSSQKLLYDLDIEAGDVVYFPRGFVHEVVTTDTISAHITLGCMNLTWLQMIDDCVSRIVQEDEAFRGTFMADRLNGKAATADVVERFRKKLEKDLSLETIEALAERYQFRVPSAPSFKFRKPETATHHP